MEKQKKSIEKNPGLGQGLSALLCWPDFSQREKEALKLDALLRLISLFPKEGEDWQQAVSLAAKRAKNSFYGCARVLEKADYHNFACELVKDTLVRKAKSFKQRLWLWQHFPGYKHSVQNWEDLKASVKTFSQARTMWQALDGKHSPEAPGADLLRSKAHTFSRRVWILQNFHYPYKFSEDRDWLWVDELSRTYKERLLVFQNLSPTKQITYWPRLVETVKTFKRAQHLLVYDCKPFWKEKAWLVAEAVSADIFADKLWLWQHVPSEGPFASRAWEDVKRLAKSPLQLVRIWGWADEGTPEKEEAWTLLKAKVRENLAKS